VKFKMFVASVLILMGAYVARPQAKYPPETRNAALRYWMAFAEMQDPPTDRSTQDLLEKTVAGEAAWDDKKLGPTLDANGAAIRMMQRATRLPDCDWGVEYDRGPRASIAYAPRARVLARLNTLEGMREMANGNSQAAVDTWLAGIRFSEHLANGGSLIFALIAKSALLPDLRALTTEAKRGGLSDAQKRQIFALLKQMREDGFDWGAAWGLEELGGERFLAELRSARNPGTTYELLMGEPIPSGANAPSTDDVRNYREYMKALQVALNLNPNAAKTRLAALEEKKVTLPEIVQRLIPHAQKENDARAEIVAARKELLEILLAK
jgi:hypothetical protein